MNPPQYTVDDVRSRGLIRNAHTFVQVEPELFLVRGRRTFYVSATLHDMHDLGLREGREGRHSL